MYTFIARVRSQAEQILQICYEDLLVDIIHPYLLATDLLRNKIIDYDVANAMLSEDLVRDEKMVMLINAIMETLAQIPSGFSTLLKALEALPSHHSVATLLKETQGIVKFILKFTHCITTYM